MIGGRVGIGRSLEHAIAIDDTDNTSASRRIRAIMDRPARRPRAGQAGSRAPRPHRRPASPPARVNSLLMPRLAPGSSTAPCQRPANTGRTDTTSGPSHREQAQRLARRALKVTVAPDHMHLRTSEDRVHLDRRVPRRRSSRSRCPGGDRADRRRLPRSRLGRRPAPTRRSRRDRDRWRPCRPDGAGSDPPAASTSSMTAAGTESMSPTNSSTAKPRRRASTAPTSAAITSGSSGTAISTCDGPPPQNTNAVRMETPSASITWFRFVGSSARRADLSARLPELPVVVTDSIGGAIGTGAAVRSARVGPIAIT